MVKKIIIGLILIGCGVSLFLSYSFLKEEVKKHKDPMITVPVNAAVVLESQNVRAIWSRISETNLVWSEVVSIPEIQKLDGKIRTIDSLFSISEERMAVLDNKKTVVSFYSNGASFDFFIATVLSESQFTVFDNLIKGEIVSVESKEIDKVKVSSFATNEGIYHYAYASPFILFASSNDVLDRSIKQLKVKKSLLDNGDFKQLRNTSSNSSALHCYVNFEESERLAFPFVQKSVADGWQNSNIFPEWGAFDLSLKADAFLFSGLTTIDSKNTFLSSVIKQEPQQSNIKNNLPKDITVLKRVSLSDSKEFLKGNNAAYLEELEGQCHCDPLETINSWIGSEILFIDHSQYQSGTIETVMIEVNGVENVQSRMTTLGVGDSILFNNHGVNIYRVENKDILLLFGKEFTLEGDIYFCQHENYVIFSSEKGMNKILRQWRKEKAVVQQSNFSSFSDRFMANFSSSDYYYKCDKLIASLEDILKREYFLKVKSYNDVFRKLGSVSWQTAPSDEQFQYHAVAINAKQGEGGNSNSLWSLKLKTAVLRSPELMKNHRTNTLEVLLQDRENTLHLISATGKIKWSKRVEGPIIGKVKQIDVYGNNKWQMLFNTSSKIHLVDINGNEVKGFPIELKSPATNSVAVLDYDKNKQYRILVACSDMKIYNYNQDGTVVDGWVKTPTESLVVNKLEHFVSDGKDYILFTDLSGKVYMVDRRGEQRVNISQRITTNLHELVRFERGFSFTNSKLIYKDSNSICKVEFNDEKSCFVLDSAHQNYDLSIVDLDGDNLNEYVVNYLNRVEIYGPDKKISLFETFDFNLKSPVKILGSSKKFLLIENEGEIYLFSDKFAPIPNFPVSGSLFTTVGDINKDGKINVVTISTTNELKVFSLEGLEAL